MVKIIFPDKKEKTFTGEPNGLEIAKSISNSFAKTCIAYELNNKLVDLNTKILKNSNIRLITTKDLKALEIMRHSAAHIMAQAVVNLYPNAQLTIGPVIKEGFYYDIDMENLSEDTFPKIEAEMKKIIKLKTPIIRKELTKSDALKFYKNEPYKIEIISELNDEPISIYEQGNFADLCRGPHVPHTGFVKHIKLMRISGAYWRANQSKQQLQRIYGTAFFKKKELDSYIQLLEEAKKRNHKKIAKEMDLVSFHNDAPGMPLFHPKGIVVWNTLLEYWREEHKRAGYLETKTPSILHRTLWEKSGHWQNYKSNMYTTTIDDQDFAIKPMNCIGGMLFYNNASHSYKELPMRIAEIGLVHRYERSGVLNGLFRVRAFHQDDAHIFMSPNQVSNEILELLKFEERICKTFGLKFELELSTKPKKSIGTNEEWESTTKDLKKALKEYGKKFKINEGDGAFYGPKIDFHIKDALNRTWQCGTIQLDLSLPKRFNLYYIGKDNKKHKPTIMHRTILGSIERFLGILIEHFAGKFPLWLTPTQVIILPINDSLIVPSQKIAKKMLKAGLRVEINTKTESLNRKIREAQISKIPLILIYGNKENESGTLSVRTLDGNIVKNIQNETFINFIVKHVKKRKINLNLSSDND